jgi:hypothetical protein
VVVSNLLQGSTDIINSVIHSPAAPAAAEAIELALAAEAALAAPPAEEVAAPVAAAALPTAVMVLVVVARQVATVWAMLADAAVARSTGLRPTASINAPTLKRGKHTGKWIEFQVG